jgi:signal transduction histidine kinase
MTMSIRQAAPPSELNALSSRRSLATLWPQLVSGAMFIVAVVTASAAGTPTLWAVAGGAGLLFAVCCTYLLAMLRKSVAGMRALTWIGGPALALYAIVLSYQLLPVSVLLIAEVAAYGLTVSDRATLRRGLIFTFGALCATLVLSELQRHGVIDIGFRLSPGVVSAVNLTAAVGIGADLLHRFSRQFDRIERSVLRVQQSNVRLAETQIELQKRLDERTKLLDVTRTVHSTLDFNTLLDNTLQQLGTLVVCDSAEVLLLNAETPPALVSRVDGDERRLSLAEDAHFSRVLEHKLPFILNNLANGVASHSWLGVPLIVRGAAIGMLSLSHGEQDHFSEHDSDLALAFANQVAGLIFNTRLRNEAAQVAVLAERNRLARELHDSVTQSLFGISLGVRTAQQELDKSAERTQQALEYTMDLANAALIEMRALIFTLRPETLQRDGLFVALQRHIDSLKPRTTIPINLSICAEEPDIAIDRKEALYRICIEAIQNALKHANAGNISAVFDCDAEFVWLSIIDDGRGFATTDASHGLGLTSMRERAAELGGRLTIDSVPNIGTTIKVMLPRKPELLLAR